MGEVARLNMDFVDERKIGALKLYLPEVKKMIQVLMSHHTENEKVYVPAIRKLQFVRDALETVTQRKLRSEMVDVEKTLINASKLFPILRFIRLPPVVFPENMNIERQVSSTPRDSKVLRTLDPLNSKSSDIVNFSDRVEERLTETSESGNQIISNISASDQHERRLAETSGLPVNKELKSLSIPRKRKSDTLINQEFAQQNVSEKYKKRSLNSTQLNSLKDTPIGSNTNNIIISQLSSKDFENIRDAIRFLKRTDNTNNEQNSHPLYYKSHLVSRVSESENHEQILQSPEYDSSSRSEQILQSPEYDSSSKSSSHKSCTLDVLENSRQRLQSLNNQSTLKSALENIRKRSQSLNYSHKYRSGSRSRVHKSRMLSSSYLKVMDWLQNTSKYNVLHSSERKSHKKEKKVRVRLRNKSRNYSTKMKEESMTSSDFSDLTFNEECETECVQKNKQQFRTADRDKSKFCNPVSTINNTYLPEFHVIRNLNEQSVEHVENIECGNDSVDTEAKKDETDYCKIVSDYIEKEIVYKAMTEIAYKAMIEKRKAMQYAARNKIFDTKNLTMENKIKNQSSDEFEIIGQKWKYIFDHAGGKLKEIKCSDLQYSNSMSASVTGVQNSDILKPNTSRTLAKSESIEKIRQATSSQTDSQKHMLCEIEHNEMERRNSVDKINNGDKKFSQNYSSSIQNSHISIPPSDGNKNNCLPNCEDVEKSVKLQKSPSSEKHNHSSHSKGNHSKQKHEERRKSTSQLHCETDFGSVKQNSHIITVDKEIRKLPDSKKSNCKDIFKSSHSKKKPTEHLQTGRKIVTKFTEKDSMTGNDVIVGLQCCNQFPRINISNNQGTAMSAQADSKEIMDASSKDKITSLTKHAHIEKTKSKHKSSNTKEKRSSHSKKHNLASQSHSKQKIEEGKKSTFQSHNTLCRSVEEKSHITTVGKEVRYDTKQTNSEKSKSKNELKSSSSKKFKECLQTGGKIVSKCCKEDCTSENGVIVDSQSLEHFSGSSHSNEKNNRSSCFKQKDSKSSHSKQKDSKSSHSKQKDSKSSHSKQKDSKSSHSKQKDSKSSHSKQEDSKSSHSKQEDSKSSHSKQKDSKSSHSKQKDSKSSHSKQKDSKSSHSKQEDSKSSHSKQKFQKGKKSTLQLHDTDFECVKKKSHITKTDKEINHITKKTNRCDDMTKINKTDFVEVIKDASLVTTRNCVAEKSSEINKSRYEYEKYNLKPCYVSLYDISRSSRAHLIHKTANNQVNCRTEDRDVPNVNIKYQDYENNVNEIINYNPENFHVHIASTAETSFTSIQKDYIPTFDLNYLEMNQDEICGQKEPQNFTNTFNPNTLVELKNGCASSVFNLVDVERDVPSANDHLERFVHTSHNVSEQALTLTDPATTAMDFTSTMLSSTPTGISRDVPSTNYHLERLVHTSHNVSKQALTLTDPATTAVDFTSTMLSATSTGISRNVPSANDHLKRFVHTSHNVSEQALTLTDPATTAVDFTSTILSSTPTGISRNVPSINDHLERLVHTSHNVSEQALTLTDPATTAVDFTSTILSSTPTGISRNVPSINDHLERLVHTSHNVSEQALTLTDPATTAMDFTSTMLSSTPTGISRDVPSTNYHLERLVHTSHNVSKQALTLTDPATTAVDFTSTILSSTPTGISRDVPSTNYHLERFLHTSHNVSEQALTLTDPATTAVDFTSTILSSTPTGISRNVPSINDHLERLVHTSHNVSEQALTLTDPATTAVDFTSTMLSSTPTDISRDVPSANDHLKRFVHTSHVSEQALTLTDPATTAVDFTSSVVSSTSTKSIEGSAEELRNGDEIQLMFDSVKSEPHHYNIGKVSVSSMHSGGIGGKGSFTASQKVPENIPKTFEEVYTALLQTIKMNEKKLVDPIRKKLKEFVLTCETYFLPPNEETAPYQKTYIPKHVSKERLNREFERLQEEKFLNYFARRGHREELFQCSFCPLTRFTVGSKTFMRSHYKLHGPTLYKCIYCTDFIATCGGRLARHVRINHVGCVIAYYVLRELETNTEDESEECTYVFIILRDIDLDMLFGTNFKKCKNCGKDFYTNVGLYAHIIKEHYRLCCDFEFRESNDTHLCEVRQHTSSSITVSRINSSHHGCSRCFIKSVRTISGSMCGDLEVTNLHSKIHSVDLYDIDTCGFLKELGNNKNIFNCFCCKFSTPFVREMEEHLRLKLQSVRSYCFRCLAFFVNDHVLQAHTWQKHFHEVQPQGDIMKVKEELVRKYFMYFRFAPEKFLSYLHRRSPSESDEDDSSDED